MEESRDIVCTVCPMGCKMKVCVSGGTVAEIIGNTCKRGADYARTEAVNPMRTLTTTVGVLGGERPVVSVKTEKPIARRKLMEAMREAGRIQCSAPICCGQVLAEDLAGTGARLIATSGMQRRN